MVVSISEQIWATSFKSVLTNHHLFVRHIRYDVDNRLVLGDPLDDGFYGKPIVLETEPDQEFLGFMLETNPVELIYFGPTNVSQVLSPFSASPPKVLLSGFCSRCHIVVNGAFPAPRVQQGLAQLVDLYSMAGFDRDDLNCISSKILTTHMRENTAAAYPVISEFTLLTPSVLSLLLFCFLFSRSHLSQVSLLFCVLLPRLAMDPSQQAFHYHLARALMHLNQLAAFLPSFDTSTEWDPASGTPRSFPHHHAVHMSRNLHRFVPLPTDTRPPPSMASHGDLPPHFVINPESHFHPILHRDIPPAVPHSNRGNTYEEFHMVEDLTHPHECPIRPRVPNKLPDPRLHAPSYLPRNLHRLVPQNDPGQSPWLSMSTGLALLLVKSPTTKSYFTYPFRPSSTPP